jgi:tripartite-type tricarboxylate transporter receptor subunit TctC
MAAKAPANGYTLLFAVTSSLTINPAIRSNVHFNTLKDFTPVSEVWIAPNVLFTNPKKYKTLKELIEAGRKKSLIYGSLGVGSLAQLSSVELAQDAKLRKMVDIPFGSNGQVMNQLMAGRLDFAFGDATGFQLAKAGRVSAIAVTGTQHSPGEPNVPTMAELGYPNVGVASWLGVVAPAGTPKAIVDRLAQALQAGFNDPAERAKVEKLGVNVAPDMSPAHFESDLQHEVVFWKGFAQKNHISIK